MNEKLLDEKFASLRTVYDEVATLFFRLYYHGFKADMRKLPVKLPGRMDFDLAFDEAFDSGLKIVLRKQMEAALELTAKLRIYFFAVVRTNYLKTQIPKAVKHSQRTVELEEIMSPITTDSGEMPMERTEPAKLRIKKMSI